MCLQRENLKRETLSLLMSAWNNFSWTNSIIAKLDKIQQKSKCQLCKNRDKIFNQRSECSRLLQSRKKSSLGKKRDPMGIVQTNGILPWKQMVYTLIKICFGEGKKSKSVGPWNWSKLLNQSQMIRWSSYKPIEHLTVNIAVSKNKKSQ